ncbi:MAG: hypothetical protein ABEL04_13115 [Salinibacter sp.]
MKGINLLTLLRCRSSEEDPVGDPGASEEKNVQYWTTNLEMTEEKQKGLARRV